MSFRTRLFFVTVSVVSMAAMPLCGASLFHPAAASNAVASSEKAKVKLVKFTLRNKTAFPMTILINEHPMTLGAREAVPVAFAEGSVVLSEDKGTVMFQVTRYLNGNTVNLL